MRNLVKELHTEMKKVLYGKVFLVLLLLLIATVAVSTNTCAIIITAVKHHCIKINIISIFIDILLTYAIICIWKDIVIIPFFKTVEKGRKIKSSRKVSKSN